MVRRRLELETTRLRKKSCLPEPKTSEFFVALRIKKKLTAGNHASIRFTMTVQIR